MKSIIPRWEWRTFGQFFGDAERRIAALTAESTRTSVEIYLLAGSSLANVKIRDQLLDIKILERVDLDDLEQWRPVLKEPFPLAAEAIAQVRGVLDLPADSPGGDAMSLDGLLAEASASGGAVCAVNVHKIRSRYHIQNCAAELTYVYADGRKVRTVAIEDADPARVIAAVKAMGLSGYKNTSYPRGLMQLLGLSEQGPLP